jgi:hypothetical protein
MFVPDVTPLIDHTLPPVFVTVPDVLVTVPEATVIVREYVERSAEQVGGVVIIMNGSTFTKLVIEGDVATHPAALVTTTSTI